MNMSIDFGLKQSKPLGFELQPLKLILCCTTGEKGHSEDPHQTVDSTTRRHFSGRIGG